MSKPEKYIFSDEHNIGLVWGVPLVGFAMMFFGMGVALVITDVNLSELVLPCAALSTFWLVWIGFFAFITWLHRVADKRAFNRMFDGEIWDEWQFSATEWEAFVDTEYNLIKPAEEGLAAYKGAVFSSIVGIIFACVMMLASLLITKEPEGRIAIMICAVAIFLLFLGVGLFQPVVARIKAHLFRRKALDVREPHIWFASEGVYHEVFGYTSLKQLIKVTDQTKSKKSILFTLLVSDEDTTDKMPFSLPVPTGYEEQAAQLVRRYRQERLQ